VRLQPTAIGVGTTAGRGQGPNLLVVDGENLGGGVGKSLSKRVVVGKKKSC